MSKLTEELRALEAAWPRMDARMPRVRQAAELIESQQQIIYELNGQLATEERFTASEYLAQLCEQIAARDAVIAKAPHADDCRCAQPDDLTGECSCWKSAAPESVLAERDRRGVPEAVTVRKVIDYLEADIDWPNIGFIVSGIAKHFGLVK